MREERIAVFPGSFDPVTLGHMDIIERAAQLFDRVYVAIVPNGEKTHPMFTDEEKLELMRVSIAPLGNVEAALWNGLLTDFAAQKGARFLVRGARNSMDFDAEYQLSLIYKDVSGGALDMVLLCAGMDVLERAFAYVDEHREEYLKDLGEICSFPAVE